MESGDERDAKDNQKLTNNRSGLLNAKHRELLDLQALAQQRLARSRARMQEGYADAKEVRRDLEWTQKRVSYVLSSHFSYHFVYRSTSIPLLKFKYCSKFRAREREQSARPQFLVANPYSEFGDFGESKS